MDLQTLINKGQLKKLDGVSIDQIKRRYEKAISFLRIAEQLSKSNIQDENLNNVIYTKIYDSVRKLGEVFLLLNGYKANGKDYHKTVLRASALLMNDDKMKIVFASLDRMRKNRHQIEYDDSLEATDQDLSQAFKDAWAIANKIDEIITTKDKQKKLI